MWLSGGNTPNFRTINRFRGKIMGEVIDEVFVEVLDYMNESSYIKLENYFIEAPRLKQMPIATVLCGAGVRRTTSGSCAKKYRS